MSLGVHLEERVGPAVHHQLLLDVEVGRLPDVVGAAVVDQEREPRLLLLLAGRLQAAPLGGEEGRLAVVGPELAVGVEALGADDPGRGRCRRGSGASLRRRDDAALLALADPRAGVALAPAAVLEADRRLLEAVGAHRPQAVVGDVLATFRVQVVAVHERVFLGLPVEALELVGVPLVARRAEDPLQMVGEPGGDQAVGHRLAGRVHVALGEPHAPLAVHRGQVHLARGRGRQEHVAGLADLRRHDVDVDREQPALPDGTHDRRDRARRGRRSARRSWRPSPGRCAACRRA